MCIQIQKVLNLSKTHASFQDIGRTPFSPKMFKLTRGQQLVDTVLFMCVRLHYMQNIWAEFPFGRILKPCTPSPTKHVQVQKCSSFLAPCNTKNSWINLDWLRLLYSGPREQISNGTKSAIFTNWHQLKFPMNIMSTAALERTTTISWYLIRTHRQMLISLSNPTYQMLSVFGNISTNLIRQQRGFFQFYICMLAQSWHFHFPFVYYSERLFYFSDSLICVESLHLLSLFDALLKHFYFLFSIK